MVSPAAAPPFIVAGFPSSRRRAFQARLRSPLRDAFGNTATDYLGIVALPATLAVLPSNYTFVAADNGVHTFSATLNTAGTRSLTVTDTHQFSADRDASRNSVGSGGSRGHRGDRFPDAGDRGEQHLHGHARDAYGNTTTGYLGTVQFISGDIQATLPANYTFVAADSGTHTFKRLP